MKNDKSKTYVFESMSRDNFDCYMTITPNGRYGDNPSDVSDVLSDGKFKVLIDFGIVGRTLVDGELTKLVLYKDQNGMLGQNGISPASKECALEFIVFYTDKKSDMDRDEFKKLTDMQKKYHVGVAEWLDAEQCVTWATYAKKVKKAKLGLDK